jgi:hypothetical protein
MSRVTGGLFLAAVFLAFLMGPPAAKADTFVINDLSDTLTVSGLGPSPVPCPGVAEACVFTIVAPDGATDFTFSGFGNIADPGGITVSDQITFVEPSFPPSGLSVTFNSDTNEIPTMGLCATGPGCKLTETGEVQTAGTVTRLGVGGATLRTDTIEFVSDITESTVVPEPASWLLVTDRTAVARPAAPASPPGGQLGAWLMLGMVVVVARPGWDVAAREVF